MPKELPGGALPEGLFRVPVEWSQHQATAVAVTSFDPGAIDSLEDEARELLEAGLPLQPLLERHTRCAVRNARVEGYRDAIAEMLGAKRPKMRAWAIAYSVGMTLTLGKSGPEIAAMFGRSKQAFFQEVDRFCERMGSRLVRLNQRDETARGKMSRRNYRPGGAGGSPGTAAAGLQARTG